MLVSAHIDHFRRWRPSPKLGPIHTETRCQKIDKALKYHKKWCVLFLGLSNTIGYWFGVTGSHDVEVIEQK